MKFVWLAALMLMRVAPAAAQADASEMYRVTLRYGHQYPATKFGDPKGLYYGIRARSCAFGVYDPAQALKQKAAGNLTGKSLKCIVMQIKGSVSRSFTGSCDGKTRVPENADPTDYPGLLNECSEVLLHELINAVWKYEYVQRLKPRAAATAHLNELGQDYDRFFGRAALEKVGAENWVVDKTSNEKQTALDVFRRAPWFGGKNL